MRGEAENERKLSRRGVANMLASQRISIEAASSESAVWRIGEKIRQ